MTAPARKPEGQIKTILIFAVLGPPIAAVLLVLTTIPLPNRGSEIAILLAIAVVLGYRVAFFPLLISGVVATVMVGELKSPLLRTAATIATAMILTYFFTVQMGRPEEDPGLFMPLYYSGFAALAALACLAISRPGRPARKNG